MRKGRHRRERREYGMMMGGGRVRSKHEGRRRWKNSGVNPEKQHCMAWEQRGEKSEKQKGGQVN